MDLAYYWWVLVLAVVLGGIFAAATWRYEKNYKSRERGDR